MDSDEENTNSGIKKFAIRLFVVTILFLWITGMTAGLMAAACKNDRYEGEKKLRYCNLSLTAGFWLRPSSLDHARSSLIYLERGIAFVELGRIADARNDFERAVNYAFANTSFSSERLQERMSEQKSRKALELWESVLASKD